MKVLVEDLIRSDHKVELGESTFLREGAFVSDICEEPFPSLYLLPALPPSRIMIDNYIHLCPLLSDTLPMVECRKWGYHHKWASDLPDFGHMIQERNRHDCLTQTHLICQHDIPVVLPWS